MGTATKSPWDGRLGIETVGKIRGCCVNAILKWRPQTVGQKLSCGYCGSTLKTIRAGEVLSHSFTGWLGEEKAAARIEEPELVIAGLFFSKNKFEEKSVKVWMEERDIAGDDVVDLDEHAFYVPLERVLPESVRAVWVASGVIGEIGVAEKQVATGGGQASMSSPGITAVSMGDGGMLNPVQGPGAFIAGAFPSCFHGLTEVQDGHQHEFFLSPEEAGDGLRVKGLSTYNNGHAHMIEAALGRDGSIDARTAPDQAPVGGHAHSHRVMLQQGMSPKNASEEDVAEKQDEDEGGTFEETPKTPSGMEETPVTKEYHVTSNDVLLLHRAADCIDRFYKSVFKGEATKVADFKAMLGYAIERAKGGDTVVEGSVKIEGGDLDWLKKCAEYLDDLGDRVSESLDAFEKAIPSKKEVDAAGSAAGKGNVEALIDWAGDVGFNGCVSAIKGSKRAMAEIDDPEKVCGWLKARAREKGVLAPEHGGKKE